MAMIAAALVALGIAAALVLNAFQSNLVFFFSPSQVAAQQAPKDRTFRIGGMVETGSLKRAGDGLTVTFRVTDTARRSRSFTRGYCPTSSRRAKASLRRAAWGRMARSSPLKCWPSTTRITCRPMPRTRSSRPESAEKRGREVMIPEIGQFALILALLLALTQGIFPIVGAARNAPTWMALARPAAHGQFTFVVLAFACLAWSFISNDFTVAMSRPIPIRSCRCITGSPRRGGRTKARCCCGC
jgi:hypothetical protein